jgi:MFS family permease
MTKQKTKIIHNPKALRAATTIMPWLIWGLAAAYYGYEFLQRVSISVYLPYLQKSLKIDSTAIGIMSAAYYYAYAFMQIPAGVLIDWLGTRKLTTLGVALVTLGTLFFGMIYSTAGGAFARLLIGLGSAFAFICCMKLIIIWFPPHRFALLAGLTNLAGYLGATLGEVPLTYFVHHYSWRYTTLGSAGIGVMLTILIALIIRDKPYREHKTKKTPVPQTTPHITQGLRNILINGRNWLNGAYAGLMVGPTSAFAALWGVTFLTHADHLSQETAASALSAIFIGVAAGSPIFGWWSDYIEKRQPLLIFAAAGSLVATLIILYFNSISIIFIFVMCFLFGFFQSAHVLNFAIAKDLNHKKNSGAAMGFTNMAVMLGGAALQPMIGLLLDWQRHGAFSHGVALYSRSTLHIALTAIPACQVVALLIAIFFLQDKKHS